MLINSDAAKKVFEKLDIRKQEIPLDEAVKYNKQLSSPSVARYDRDELLREYREESAETIQNSFKKRSKKQILIGKIKYLIPKSIKRLLLKIRYRK